MNRGGRIALGAALALLLWAPARAELLLQKVQWQQAKLAAQRLVDIDTLKIEGPRLSGKLRGKVTLLNRGPRAVEGILLRYALTAKLVPASRAGDGVWAVPFLLDQRRIPKVGPNRRHEVPLDFSPLFEAYLKRIYREGFRPAELKLQVMIEPRRGQDWPLTPIESSLNVSSW